MHSVDCSCKVAWFKLFLLFLEIETKNSLFGLWNLTTVYGIQKKYSGRNRNDVFFPGKIWSFPLLSVAVLGMTDSAKIRCFKTYSGILNLHTIIINISLLASRLTR